MQPHEIRRQMKRSRAASRAFSRGFVRDGATLATFLVESVNPDPSAAATTSVSDELPADRGA